MKFFLKSLIAALALLSTFTAKADFENPCDSYIYDFDDENGNTHHVFVVASQERIFDNTGAWVTPHFVLSRLELNLPREITHYRPELNSCLERVTDFEIIADHFSASESGQILTEGRGLIITAPQVEIDSAARINTAGGRVRIVTLNTSHLPQRHTITQWELPHVETSSNVAGSAQAEEQNWHSLLQSREIENDSFPFVLLTRLTHLAHAEFRISTPETISKPLGLYRALISWHPALSSLFAGRIGLSFSRATGRNVATPVQQGDATAQSLALERMRGTATHIQVIHQNMALINGGYNFYGYKPMGVVPRRFSAVLLDIRTRLLPQYRALMDQINTNRAVTGRYQIQREDFQFSTRQAETFSLPILEERLRQASRTLESTQIETRRVIEDMESAERSIATNNQIMDIIRNMPSAVIEPSEGAQFANFVQSVAGGAAQGSAAGPYGAAGGAAFGAFAYAFREADAAQLRSNQRAIEAAERQIHSLQLSDQIQITALRITQGRLHLDQLALLLRNQYGDRENIRREISQLREQIAHSRQNSQNVMDFVATPTAADQNVETIRSELNRGIFELQRALEFDWKIRLSTSQVGREAHSLCNRIMIANMDFDACTNQLYLLSQQLQTATGLAQLQIDNPDDRNFARDIHVISLSEQRNAELLRQFQMSGSVRFPIEFNERFSRDIYRNAELLNIAVLWRLREDADPNVCSSDIREGSSGLAFTLRRDFSETFSQYFSDGDTPSLIDYDVSALSSRMDLSGMQVSRSDGSSDIARAYYSPSLENVGNLIWRNTSPNNFTFRSPATNWDLRLRRDLTALSSCISELKFVVLFRYLPRDSD